jgi:two-component system sensor histidine kinase BaeS
VSRPRSRLRNRLLVAMVAVAFGVLVVSLVGAAALARRSSATSATNELKNEAPSVAAELDSFGKQFRTGVLNRAAGRQRATQIRRLVARVLAVSHSSIVTIQPDGTLVEGATGLLGLTANPAAQAAAAALALPKGVSASDLDTKQLLAGQQQTGQSGDTVFVARPLTPIGTNTPVVVLSQHVDTQPLGRAGGFLLVTGAIALVAAGLVSAYLARRMTRPLAAMQETAGRIADGDLAARVRLRGSYPDDELASLARSINAMANDLETARGHERAFLLSVSHDLRTPLTSIKGYAEAIADGTVADADLQVRSARIIESEARRLERLVADLLDLARLDAHQFSLTPRPVDARRVVEETVAGFLPSAREWGVRLDVESGTAVPVDADPERLAQVVANLVENALKYAAANVRVAVEPSDGRVEVRVDDDGPGVPSEERERVFERLYTARGAPSRKVGTGIGLAIVHELAGAMGGTALCQPLPSGGTRFVVAIPAGAPAPVLPA